VDEVAGAIVESEEGFAEASRNIGKLRDYDPNPAVSRFQEASSISNLALALAQQRQLYQIMKSSLDVAPKNIEDLEKLIEKESKWDWANIPTTIIDRRYDPNF
jgi:hypothetical protein